MEINIDFLVAGCNTRCKHCYVNGGPNAMMPIEDILTCIAKLDEMAKYLPNGTSFTLDHEPMNHPHLDQILNAASHTRYITNFHHGMTTGIALMHRKDKETVIQKYFNHGYRTFGITIHGSATHHDEIVRRKGAYNTSVQTAKFLLDIGAKVDVSLMLNRYFAEDADGITQLLDDLKPENIWLAIPIFAPHSNMKDFEPYRATLETFDALKGYLTSWRQNEPKLLQKAQENSIGIVRHKLLNMNLQQLWEEEQTELYLTLHADCKLYVGNSGTETQCLGDLRMLDPQKIAYLINALPGNRDYGAFYQTSVLPSVEELDSALASLPQTLVYGDMESVIYRGLTELGVPTRISSN